MKAVLDVGTNSVRLLVAEVTSDCLKPLITETIVTRLGEGVDESHSLSTMSMARTLNAVADLVALIPSGVPTSILATSAVRDASNRQDFAKLVHERIGLSLEILPGLMEAELSFSGAVFSLKRINLQDPITVVDIGGGSTEIYTGTAQGGLLWGGSAQVGAVRMLERFEKASHSAMEREVEELLRPLVQENLMCNPKTLVAVGGTATSLAAMIQNLPAYNDEKVTGFSFSLTQLTDMYNKLGRLSMDERRQIPSLQSGREDVIVYGAAILVKVVSLLGFKKTYSSVGDLLYGKLIGS